MKMKIKIRNHFGLLMAIILLSSINNTQAASVDVEITLNFTNLANPGDDHYEGWLIVDGSPVSTGKFTMDDAGALVDLDGNSIDTFDLSVDLDVTTTFVLSLEPSGDTDTTPAVVKPLAGDLNSDKTSATLSANLGVDLGTPAGSYILATPTNGADTNENSGIWWLDPSSGTPVATLVLPDLSDTDWIYEGWVVIDGTPVSTGTFDGPAGADDADPYSGDEDAPPFPGEDFLDSAPTGLTFPTNIAGDTAVISIEPRMDNDAAPFQFKPLVGNIPASADDHVVYDMDDMSSTLAVGSVSIDEKSNDDDTPGFGIFILTLSLLPILGLRKKYNN